MMVIGAYWYNPSYNNGYSLHNHVFHQQRRNSLPAPPFLAREDFMVLQVAFKLGFPMDLSNRGLDTAPLNHEDLGIIGFCVCGAVAQRVEPRLPTLFQWKQLITRFSREIQQ